MARKRYAPGTYGRSRKINGKIYTAWRYESTLREAEHAAKMYRKAGGLARVIKSTWNGRPIYWVYVHALGHEGLEKRRKRKR